MTATKSLKTVPANAPIYNYASLDSWEQYIFGKSEAGSSMWTQ